MVVLYPGQEAEFLLMVELSRYRDTPAPEVREYRRRRRSGKEA